jgi:hypothetical protein
MAAMVLGAGLAASLSAQGAFPFQLVIKDQAGNATTVADNAILNIASSAVGTKISITIVATYRGINVANLGLLSLLGSSEFAVTIPPATASLNPGDAISVQVTFTPTSSAQATGQLTIPFTENGPATSTNPAGPVLTSGVIAFSLTGTAPQFLISYFLQNVQNVLPLADGGTLSFPATLVPGSSQAIVQIQNTGTGPGPINAIKVTGATFQAFLVPLLPGTLNTNSTLQFSITYTPTQAGADTGTLEIDFPDHTVTVTLSGTGTAPTFVYQLIVGGQASSITPNQTLSFSSGPLVPVSFTITVQNTGTGNGTLAGLSLSGVGFGAVDVPALPQVLMPGAIASFNFAFDPPQVGSFSGRLRIGNDTFTLSGSGTGPQLAYFFTFASAPVTLAPGATVPFSPVQIGQSAGGTFTIQNSGTAPATVIGIYIGDAKSAFSLSGLPPMPVTLAPGDKTTFAVAFAPVTNGLNTSVLHVDAALFTLAGSGNVPPDLPGFSYQGTAGVVGPLQQPSIGLSLNSPYALPLSGTLTITQNPQGFSVDPSVQFSSGGGVVAFTIPANTTQAVFPNNTTSIRLQTGSIANTITVTPSFSTAVGYSLTPANPATLQFTVPSSAPQLSSMLITQTAANGFTLQIAGVVTSRSLTTLNFTFTAQSQFNIANTALPVDVSTVATNWFQSNASAGFGGQFLILVPFSLATASTSVTATLPAIQSVSVTATNEKGTSNPVTTQFQ